MKMEFRILPGNLPTPDLLDERGRLRLLPAAAYDQIHPQALQAWCNRNARYGLPTVELVQWLKERIAGRRAIEIGSGSGDLAFHLGIPATDSKMQKRKSIQAQYALFQQPTIRYPKFVRNLEALEAIAELKPEVVVASWVTQWIDPNLPPPPGGGCAWGVREDRLLATGVTYILIGNLHVHHAKPILALPHEEHALPFLRSRANHLELDRVWVWNGKDS